MLTVFDGLPRLCSVTLDPHPAGCSRRRLKFLGATRYPVDFPPADVDTREVVFAGRSNVGKSSLVNRLTKSSPAVAENKPGVTQVGILALDSRGASLFL